MWKLLITTLALLFLAPTAALAQSAATQKKAIRDIERAQMQPVLEFLSLGGDPNARSEHGGSLLQTATNWNQVDAVKSLLARGADPNLCRTSGECALFVSTGRDTEILRMLVDAGADPNRATEKLQQTPLGRAAGNRPATFVQLTASGSYRGPVPNSVESVRILLGAGANPNHVDAFGESPLRAAMRVNNLEIAALLLRSGADVHQRIDDSTSRGEQSGNTILMETIGWYALFKDAMAVRLLLANGANPNDRNELEYDAECDATTSGKCSWRGYTVLTYAAKNGLTNVVRLLLQYGADATAPRGDGKTALELAQEHRHPATVSLLRQHSRK